MNIYIMYGLIILITILIFIIIKDKSKALKLTGSITIISSLLLIILILIIKIIINESITMINLSSLTNHIFKKFINTSLILFIVGIIEILVGKYLFIKKR